MMYYWNQKNFEGLKQISEYYRQDKDFNLFSQYCDFREKGLRKLALEKIQNFVTYCKGCSFQKQLDISFSLLDLIYTHAEVHQLLANPLKQYLIQVLQQQKVLNPKDAIIFQWLGYLTHDISMYETGFELDTTNQICLKAILSYDFDRVDWQTHHLYQSFFIGSVEDAYERLAHAENLILNLASSEDKKFFTQIHQYYLDLLQAWEHYQALDTSIGFPDWCAQNQRQFEYDQAVYY